MSLLATSKDRLYTAILAVIIVLAVLLGYFLFSGGKTHTVYAEFTNAQFIVPGNTVHVNGDTVGKVASMSVANAMVNGTEQQVARVKLTLTGRAWPLHQNASATVRPISILGEQYVDLDTGTTGTMQDGGTIAANDTTSATNLQSVLNSVTDPTAVQVSTLVSSLGAGMAGEGQNTQDAIKALEPAMTNTAGLLKLLNSQNSLLNQMIDNVSPVLHALNTNQGSTLDTLVTTTNNLLGATATTSGNLGRDLQELPPTLEAATNTFNQLGNLSDQATPALASLTPLTGNLNQVSNEIEAFSQAANPAVNSLTPLLAQAQTLINKATPVVNDLRTTESAGLNDLRNGESIFRGNVADLHNFYAFIAEWASTTGDYDSTGHYFRFHAQGSCAMTGALGTPVCNDQSSTAQGNNPSAGTQPVASGVTPVKPAAAKPATATPAPSVGGTINSILTQPNQIVGNVVGGLLGGLVPSSPATPNTSATGLSPSQEQNLVGYLLGGL